MFWAARLNSSIRSQRNASNAKDSAATPKGYARNAKAMPLFNRTAKTPRRCARRAKEEGGDIRTYAGTSAKKPSACKGKGETTSGGERTVEIPKGTASGDTIRLNKSPGEDNGIIVTIEVKPHPVFTKVSHDIHSKISISKEQALSGGEMVVETVHGKTKIMLPKGLEKDTEFTIPLYGAPHSFPNQHMKGDHIVHITINA